MYALLTYFSIRVLIINAQGSIENKQPYSFLLLNSQSPEIHICTTMALKCILTDGYFLSCHKAMKKIQLNVWVKSAVSNHHCEPCYEPRLQVSSLLPCFLAAWDGKRVQETQSHCGFTRELRLPLMNMHDEP